MLGIPEIDQRIRRIAGGEVLTILARSGSFKTAMLQNLLKNFNLQNFKKPQRAGGICMEA